MQAAQRLSEIYTAYMIQAEKAAARLKRAEARSAAQRGQQGALDTQESPSEANGLNEDEQLSAVFGSILNGKGKDSDGTECECE